MIKNYRGFLSWQGNNWVWQDWFKYMNLGILVVVLISVFVFKDVIYRKFGQRKKILWFKDHDSFWMWVGIFCLTLFSVRLIIFIVGSYPFYWEDLGMHLCRIHMELIFISLAIKKKEWVKYFTYIALLGVIFGFFFGSMTSPFINWVNGPEHTNVASQDINYWATEFAKHKGLAEYHPSLFERIMFSDGVTFYNAGPDTFAFYEFVFGHIAIVLIPLFIRSAYKISYSHRELFWVNVWYAVGATFIWIINLSMSNVPNEHWRANNWYIGTDVNNDFSTALGPLSAWPQNLFSYTLIGLFFGDLFHYLWIWLDKFHFFTGKKIIGKSQHWISVKQEFKAGFKFFAKKESSK